MTRRATAALAADALLAAAVPAAATPPDGGPDILHVPMSWCAVRGSPAADSPSILPEDAENRSAPTASR